jgi:hypothetical protein
MMDFAKTRLRPRLHGCFLRSTVWVAGELFRGPKVEYSRAWRNHGCWSYRTDRVGLLCLLRKKEEAVV